MIFFAFKVLISSLIIAFASWLSFKKPILAGFIIALPIISMISIVFSYNEHKSLEQTVLFAKSILTAIPISLLFFVPFFLSKTLGLNFLTTYFSGVLLLIVGYFIHKYINNLI